jgi:branched-chain amino acid transport system permease protein
MFWSVFLGQLMGYILITTAAWALIQVAGQPAFSIAALAGIGVYGFALLAKMGTISPWVALILGVIIATGVGMLLSIPSMKIGGIMNQGILNIFFIFAFAGLVNALSKYTGGSAGIPLSTLPPSDFFSQVQNKYLIIMILSIIGVLAIYAILKTRVGKIISLTAKNEPLAGSLGINITKYKRLAYLLFVPFIALAGFCISYTTGFTSPSTWTTDLSFLVILSFWIGGAKSLWGPIIGAVLINSIPTAFNLALEWRIVFCGVLALLIRMYLPQGITGVFQNIIAKREARLSEQNAQSNTSETVKRKTMSLDNSKQQNSNKI